MARKLFSEIFTQVKKATKNADKAEILKKHAGLPLFYVLWVAFSDKVEWLLPEDAPPYVKWEDQKEGRRKNLPGSEPSDLHRELRRLYVFFKGSGDHVTRLKREKLFQDLLETVPGGDAELIIAIKDKTFSTKYKLSKKLLEETFPGLLEAPINLKFITTPR